VKVQLLWLFPEGMMPLKLCAIYWRPLNPPAPLTSWVLPSLEFIKSPAFWPWSFRAVSSNP
jgi:hypothetical protein